jgi:hypothetical protein
MGKVPERVHLFLLGIDMNASSLGNALIIFPLCVLQGWIMEMGKEIPFSNLDL